MTFADRINARLRRISSGHTPRDSLALWTMEYAQELDIKNHALRELLSRARLPAPASPIIPSPRPRRYRTTTKRRALMFKGKTRLAFADDKAGKNSPTSGIEILEPPEHIAMYSFVEKTLREPVFQRLARVMNYVIVRGTYEERSVVFNVRRLDALIVRRLKAIAKRVGEFDPGAVSAFAFVDPRSSRYYLDISPVPQGVKVKKLFGRDTIRLALQEGRYLYPPVIFSQVNQSMIPHLLASAARLLEPSPRECLVDLYCGYGLFTHHLAPSCARSLGIDAQREAVEAARGNTRFFAPGAQTVFKTGRIDSASLPHLLGPAGQGSEIVLSDPPRQGMPPDVIGALCRRKPPKVVQAVCGIDNLERQARLWESGDYRPVSLLALDMFAGIAHLEVLVLFEPS